MDRKDDPLGEYERPTMDFEREPTIPQGMGRWMGVGVEFGFYVVVFFLVGKWLDGKFGWHSWGMTVGCLLGVAIGTVLLIRRVKRASDSDG